MKCPHCEKEIAGTACPECYEESPEGAEFCMKCGAELAPPVATEGGGDDFDLENRTLCPDGTCTGIIADGKCTECGKPYPPKPGATEEVADEETPEETVEESPEETPEEKTEEVAEEASKKEAPPTDV